jgi:RNA polymerase sigma-70 factor (ECF subfamily)
MNKVVDPATSNVRRLPSRPSPRLAQVEFAGDRAVLVAALRRGDEGAAAALFHEYSPLVERTLGRILGVDADLPDALQEVFLRSLRSVHLIRDPQALTQWLLRITVCTAKDWLRSRARRGWLLFADPTQIESPRTTAPDESGREALRATYRVLARLGTEDRTVFALRFIDGMELDLLAAACDCSVSTAKRRIRRAQARFTAMARREPALLPWLATSAPEEEEAL